MKPPVCMSNVLGCATRIGLLLSAGCMSPQAHADSPWRLWASGLQQGVYPHLAVGPDHTLYYGLTGTGLTRGLIFQANNSLASSGTFTALPPIPYVSLTNNIRALTTNASGDPIVGIMHGNAPENLNDPAAFVFDRLTQTWHVAGLSVPVSYGIISATLGHNGEIWLGGQWTRIYHSTDGGYTYTAINEWETVSQAAPCYYPTWGGNPADGMIFSVRVDRRGYIYAGTEGAGVIFSADNGAHWQPLDAFACMPDDPLTRNPASPMEAASRTGNTGAIGFTADNQPVWNGTSFWSLPGWTQSLGHADLTTMTAGPVYGFPDFFVTQGTQVSRIVTTDSGTLFLHSGKNASFDPNPPAPPLQSAFSMGLYRSTDGIHWTQFNDGITSDNNGYAQGSLAVDGNRVFTATPDGKVWYLDVDAVRIFLDGFEP